MTGDPGTFRGHPICNLWEVPQFISLYRQE